MSTTTATVLSCRLAGPEPQPDPGDTTVDRRFRSAEGLLRAEIDAHGGRLLGRGGHSFMAVFDAASDGVIAAIAVQRAVEGETPPVDVRVGVSAGDVSWDNDECYGYPVVVAARLVSAAESSSILVSAVVRLMAGERSPFHFVSVGGLELDGLADPVDAFRVEWRGEPAGETTWLLPPTLRTRAEQPFVGRRAELSTVLDRWEEVREGSRSVVLLGGEPGAGKTRLAAEIARHCADHGALVLAGACDRELAMPYQPWAIALDALVAQLPQHVVGECGAELAALRHLVPRIERVVSALPSGPQVEPETEQRRMFDGLIQLLQRVSAEAPVVLVLDDLHWAGPQTIAMLRLIARAPVTRLLILGTFRDAPGDIAPAFAKLLADSRSDDHVVRIGIEGLDTDAVADLLVAIGVSDEISARAPTIAARTGGNPFLVTELARSGGDRVPDSVRDIANERLSQATEEAVRLGQLVAVAGRLDLFVLRQSSGLDTDAFASALPELLGSGLIEELDSSRPEYQFTHALWRDAIASGLDGFARARAHECLAVALEHAFEADRRPVLADLARHYAAAAGVVGPAKAVHYGRRAANHARRTAAYDEGVMLLDATLGILGPGGADRAQLLIEKANLLARGGQNRRATDAAHEACVVAAEAGDRALHAHAAIELERTSQLRGMDVMIAEAERHLTAVLEDADELSPNLRISSRAALCRARVLRGDRPAVDDMGACLDSARSSGDVETLSHVLEVAVIVEDDPSIWLEHCMELERLTADAGNVFRSMWAKARRVHALITQGRLSEARQVVDQLGDLARTYDFVMFRYEVQVFSSTLALADGRFEEAESFAEAAHADDDPRFDDIDSSGAYGLQVFMIRREQGRLEEMRPVLQLLGDDTDVGIWQPGLVLALAELDMHHDARPGFEALVDEQLAAVPDDALRPIALAFLSDVCVLLDETETAPLLLAALEPFGGQILAAGFTTAAGPADRFRALLAELDGQSDLADGLLARAHDLAERSGSPVWQTHVRHARGWLAQRRGTRKPTSEFPDGLTAREAAVLAELATGATNKQIGAVLHISPNTAANHVRSILQKTGCANRTEAAAYAIQHGLERLHTGTPHSVGP